MFGDGWPVIEIVRGRVMKYQTFIMFEKSRIIARDLYKIVRDPKIGI